MERLMMVAVVFCFYFDWFHTAKKLISCGCRRAMIQIWITKKVVFSLLCNVNICSSWKSKLYTRNLEIWNSTTFEAARRKSFSITNSVHAASLSVRLRLPAKKGHIQRSKMDRTWPIADESFGKCMSLAPSNLRWNVVFLFMLHTKHTF